MARLAYLTITYQLVKLFAAALKKAAKTPSRKPVYEVVFLESGRSGDWYGGSADELSTRLLTAFFREVANSFTR